MLEAELTSLRQQVKEDHEARQAEASSTAALGLTAQRQGRELEVLKADTEARLQEALAGREMLAVQLASVQAQLDEVVRVSSEAAAAQADVQRDLALELSLQEAAAEEEARRQLQRITDLQIQVGGLRWPLVMI